MSLPIEWIRLQFAAVRSHPPPAFWQGVLHLSAIYAVARIFAPWLSNFAHDILYPYILRRPAGGGSWQFFFTHLFAISFIPALLVGYLNSKLLLHRIGRYVWTIPVAILVIVFVFAAPGIYPTMILESDFARAFHYYFGGDFEFHGEFHTYREFARGILENRDFQRGWDQFRITVPAYAGIAYSLGACFSTPLRKVPEQFVAADEPLR
jgi:hypothetical protein